MFSCYMNAMHLYFIHISHMHIALTVDSKWYLSHSGLVFAIERTGTILRLLLDEQTSERKCFDNSRLHETSKGSRAGYNWIKCISIDSVGESIWPSRANKIKFLLSSICLAICKADASSACLSVTKLMLITLYCKFKQFADIYEYIFLIMSCSNIWANSGKKALKALATQK